MHVHTRRN